MAKRHDVLFGGMKARLDLGGLDTSHTARERRGRVNVQ